MDEILIKPQQVRAVAQNIREHAREVQCQIQNVDKIIHSLPNNFQGHRADDVMRRYRAIRDRLFTTWKRLSVFADKLEEIAERFEAADRRLVDSKTNWIQDLWKDALRIGGGLPQWLPHWPWFLPKPWPPRMPKFPFPFPNWPPIFLPEIPRLPFPFPGPTWPIKPPKIGVPDFNLPDWIKDKIDDIFTPIDSQPPVSGDNGGSTGETPLPPVDDNSGGQTPTGGGSSPGTPGGSGDETVTTPTSNYDPQKTVDAINSLDVTKNPDYTPFKNGNTYCNIFAADVAEKMGAPMPKHLDWNSDGTIDRYLNANLMVRWLRGDFQEGGSAVQQGPALGWQTVGADDAARYASKGLVVVAGWENPAGTWEAPGHMAVVRPNSTPGDIRIAQAGGSNFEDGPIVNGFGKRQVEYFVYNPEKASAM